MITQLDRAGLIVSDADRSAAFYTDCLGMELVTRRASTEFNPNVGVVFDVPDAIILKLIRLTRGAFYLILFEIEPRGRQHALPVHHPGSLALGLASDSIEEDQRRLATMAADTTPLAQRGGLTTCYASDPDGATVGFVGNLPSGIDALLAITATDAAGSAAFYANFGLTPLPELDHVTEEGERAVGMRLGSVAFRFNEHHHDTETQRLSPMNNVGAVQLDFFSDDVDSDFARVRDRGATVISPPVSTRRGSAATGFDPDGVMWELSSDDGRPKTVEYHQTVYHRP